MGKMLGEIKELSSKQAWQFLEPRHYAGRKPPISVAFGWYVDGQLVAVCTFGKPGSPFLCKGICGEQFKDCVYELNRLCRTEEFDGQLSQFVSACLRILKKKRWIIVSFSDTGMSHNGYIYQACNFYFTGQTKQRTDIYSGGQRHPRHYTQDDKQSGLRVLRTAKNRYVYFATRIKSEKKKWLQSLKYPILPYPKAQNKNYVLGQYQKPILVEAEIKNEKV